MTTIVNEAFSSVRYPFAMSSSSADSSYVQDEELKCEARPDHCHYGLEPHENFSSPIVQLLLNLEARRFAAYLSASDFWHLRQVSRQFRRWCLSPENEAECLRQAFMVPGCNTRGLQKLADESRLECLARQTSWSGMTVLLQNTYLRMQPPREITFPDGEWSIVNDQMLDAIYSALASIDHHPGPERFYSSSWRPPHDLKNIYLLKRNPNSSLTVAESIVALITNIRGPPTLDLTLHQDLVYYSSTDPFPMFRQCLPYASEPELHLTIFLLRAGLAYKPLRNLMVDVHNQFTPTRALQLFKTMTQTLLYAIEEEEEDSLGELDALDDGIVCPIPNLIPSLRQYAQGVLALDPAHFWDFPNEPLPELTEDLKTKYLRLAEAYIDHTNYQVAIVPWFDVPNLVIKGATINFQLYLLECAGDHVKRSGILKPFSGLPKSLGYCGTPSEPYDGLILPEALRSFRSPTLDDGNDGGKRDFLIRLTLSTLHKTSGRCHRGDAGALYVGPHGAYFSSCKDDILTAFLAVVGITTLDDCV